MKILVTGCAGFIGFHLCFKLLHNYNYRVFGIDNLNNYYDKKLKINRLSILKKSKKFNFKKIDIKNKKLIKNNFLSNKYDVVIHLAAQAGVRYSILNPSTYFNNNLLGFFNILDNCRINKVSHFIFASTSSVYGDKKKFPINEKQNTDEPLSFYAATKKSNEVMAYSYSNIFQIPCTGLRFFTAYGPYGRPDMSLYKFTKSILNKESINLFNNGKHVRDFTYVDDIVKYVIFLIKNPSNKKIPYEIYNIGSGNPNTLVNFLNIIENNLNIKSLKNKVEIQKGDVYKTHADISKIYKIAKFKPSTGIKLGIKRFVKWYKEYNEFN